MIGLQDTVLGYFNTVDIPGYLDLLGSLARCVCAAQAKKRSALAAVSPKSPQMF